MENSSLVQGVGYQNAHTPRGLLELRDEHDQAQTVTAGAERCDRGRKICGDWLTSSLLC